MTISNMMNSYVLFIVQFVMPNAVLVCVCCINICIDAVRVGYQRKCST